MVMIVYFLWNGSSSEVTGKDTESILGRRDGGMSGRECIFALVFSIYNSESTALGKCIIVVDQALQNAILHGMIEMTYAGS